MVLTYVVKAEVIFFAIKFFVILKMLVVSYLRINIICNIFNLSSILGFH